MAVDPERIGGLSRIVDRDIENLKTNVQRHHGWGAVDIPSGSARQRLHAGRSFRGAARYRLAQGRVDAALFAKLYDA
jgi:hypothetical protein